MKSSQTDPAVISFIEELDHPMKATIEALRRLILDVSPAIHEGIKWKSPSFRTTDYFATLNLRAKNGEDRVWLILHTGAKVKETGGVQVADPTKLLQWLAKDRCVVTFGRVKDVKAVRPALQAILLEWIRQF